MRISFSVDTHNRAIGMAVTEVLSRTDSEYEYVFSMKDGS
jgi:hypothetical protein